VGLFRPYEQGDRSATKDAHASKKADDAAVASKTDAVDEGAAVGTEVAAPARKKVATPTRTAAQQARRERLHPTLSRKETKARERQMRVTKRVEQNESLEAQPGRVLARDYVDCKRRYSSFAMPAIFVSLLISILGSMAGPEVMAASTGLVWIIIVSLAIDVFFTHRGFKQLHAVRLPNESFRGLSGYLINRAINPRRIRMPPPRVNVGDKI